MTAQEAIAQTLARADGSDVVPDWCEDYASRVVEAIRAMPIDAQAELIRGRHETRRTGNRREIRLVGPWL